MSVQDTVQRRQIDSVSILIPAYNEADNIEAMLDDLSADPWVKSWGDAAQVIVVDDGSADGTSKRASTRIDKFRDLQILTLSKNVGKGQALAAGINAAKGDVVVFLDGDHTFDFEALPRFVKSVEEGADVVVGDRRDPKSVFFVPAQVIPYIHFRHFIGQRFNTVVRMLTDLDIADTQCGFKMFTKEAARHSFSKIKVGGFIFDVEVLIAAQQAGYRIKALPVRLRYDSPEPIWETINLSAKVSRSLLRVLRGKLRGAYAKHDSTDSADD